ncbi:dephospho-CoA kinase [Cerasicoccus maritimus]|uniref:dephospho-CoA kinase n=1 Tax=Cerasicoccus maritimus TaxID=490089 RepID=UPI002852CF96|nr:dephospho-CoA kinase [Cerasicoccus maritimus]
MRIGLTGGIGCGKSSAGKCFAELGWRRLDSDAIVRDLLANDAGLHASLRECWGEEAVLPEGGANRSFIAGKVFHDKAELSWWEGLVLPKVRETWQGALATEPDVDWVVEVPLLFEKDLQGNFDRTVCVEAPQAVQLARLAAKGLDREQSLARINNQMPVLDKARCADLVLSNAGSLEFLQRQVRRASEMLRSFSR